MTFGSRITNVKIWGAPDFWEAVPGELPNGAADPAQYRSLILTTLERIYDQGGGSSMIDEAISRGGGFLRIGNEMTFGNRFVNEPGYVPYILISTEFTEATYFFNDRGKLVQNKFELALAHEVAHAAGHIDPSDGERSPDVEANAADYDYRGGAVDFQNSVALTLNLPGYVRSSYLGGFTGSQAVGMGFELGGDYSLGEQIDISRVGTVDSDIQDMRARLDNSRDLLFGLAGDDQIFGGGGRDFIYGGAGDDTLSGGNGDDIFDGGTGSDQIWGGDLNAAASASDGSDEVRYDRRILITFSATAGSELTVSPTGYESDTLHSIERITGSDDNDRILIWSSSPALLNALEWIDLGADTDGIRDEVDWRAADAVKVDLAAGRLELISNPSAGFALRNVESVSGGAGDDIIIGNDASNTLGGGVGRDEIHGGAGDDSIGGAGLGDDRLWGGSGNDAFYVSDGDVIYDIDAGDSVHLFAGPLEGAPELYYEDGVEAPDENGVQRYWDRQSSIIYHWAPGSTTLIVNGLTIYEFQNGDAGIRLGRDAGTAGDDTLNGDGGKDSLYGLRGNDTLAGGGGDDFLDGGDGDDAFLVAAGGGFDTFYGGAGLDTIAATADGAVLGLRRVNGVETITAGGHANVTIRTTDDGEDWNFWDTEMVGIAEIDVGGGDDILVGHSLMTRLHGGAGHDEIYSQQCDDALFGGAGDDYLSGWQGDDHYSGGAGDDFLTDEYGDDAYHYALGDGHDVIDEWEGYDVLAFGAGISPSDVSMAIEDEDVMFTIAGGGEVRIFWGVYSDYAIDEVRFADQTIWYMGSGAAVAAPGGSASAGSLSARGSAYAASGEVQEPGRSSPFNGPAADGGDKAPLGRVDLAGLFEAAAGQDVGALLAHFVHSYGHASGADDLTPQLSI